MGSTSKWGKLFRELAPFTRFNFFIYQAIDFPGSYFYSAHTFHRSQW